MIQTSGIKYMGSKQKFIDEILSKVNLIVPNEQRQYWTALDVFAGSTKVAQALRQSGFKTLSSEILWAGEAYAHAYLCNPTADRQHLQEIIDYLNNIKPLAGWLTENYCEVKPADPKDETKLVNAFTRPNGMKADAIREEIEILKEELETWEYMTLLASLVIALDVVQNSQGHSRAFFREFIVPASKRPLELKLPALIGNPNLEFEGTDEQFVKKYPIGAHFLGDVLCSEYLDFITENKTDQVVAYLDPPYTAAAQYNLFYHLWDSVVKWDKPEVGGATNRRKDRMKGRGKEGVADLESAWTKKKEARGAFVKLFKQLDFVNAFIISYNNESILSYQDMIDIFEEFDFFVTETHEKQYRRHALSKSGRGADIHKNANMKNTEYIFVIASKHNNENIIKTLSNQSELLIF